MRISILLFLLAFRASGQSIDYIELDNGDKITGQIEYKTPFMAKPYLLVDGTTKYDLTQQVKSYQLQGVYYKKFFMSTYGKPIFFQRTAHGKIDSWYRATTVINGHGGASSKRWDYYSFENGPLKKMRFRFVKKDLKESPEAMKVIKKIKGLRVVSGLGYLGGSALIIGGAVSISNTKPGENPGFPPTLIAGALIFNINLFLLNSKREKMIEAIDAYNMEVK
ncbi:MAG: hypothetical protein QM734_07565 [Cyclobacteriaceae bacterium]